MKDIGAYLSFLLLWRGLSRIGVLRSYLDCFKIRFKNIEICGPEERMCVEQINIFHLEVVLYHIANRGDCGEIFLIILPGTQSGRLQIDSQFLEYPIKNGRSQWQVFVRISDIIQVCYQIILPPEQSADPFKTLLVFSFMEKIKQHPFSDSVILVGFEDPVQIVKGLGRVKALGLEVILAEDQAAVIGAGVAEARQVVHVPVALPAHLHLRFKAEFSHAGVEIRRPFGVVRKRIEGSVGSQRSVAAHDDIRGVVALAGQYARRLGIEIIDRDGLKFEIDIVLFFDTGDGAPVISKRKGGVIADEERDPDGRVLLRKCHGAHPQEHHDCQEQGQRFFHVHSLLKSTL